MKLQKLFRKSVSALLAMVLGVAGNAKRKKTTRKTQKIVKK